MLSALKNFGVTFLISTVLFGVIAYFVTGFVTNTVGDMFEEDNDKFNEIIQNEETETTPEQTNPVTDEKIPEGDSFNFLIATTDFRPDIYDDYQPDSELIYDTGCNELPPDETLGCLSEDYRKTNLTSLVVVRIDKEKREFVYTYFSPNIRVYTSTGYHTLAEVYRISGIKRVAEHLYAMSGLKIKYQAVIDGYNFDEMINQLGGVDFNLTKDIYTDGKYNTMQTETTVKRVGPNGGEWTEHIPNAYLLGHGDINLTEDNVYTVISAQEHSSAELSAKEAYIIEILQKYLTKFAEMEEDQFRITLAKLLTKEIDWIYIEGYEPPGESADPVPEDKDETENPDNEDEDERIKWHRELYEPDTAVMNTDFTMNKFDEIKELFGAVTYFENKIISYPVIYVASDEEHGEYFEANVNSGIEIFMDYRG